MLCTYGYIPVILLLKNLTCDTCRITTLRQERENLLHEVLQLRRQIACPGSLGSARAVPPRLSARIHPELFSPPSAAAAICAGGTGRLQADGGGILAAAGTRTSPSHAHDAPQYADGGADALVEPDARARAADSGSANNATVLAVRREIRSLRQVIRSLEEELLKQKNEHQRTLQKRSGEYRSLVDEVGTLAIFNGKLHFEM